jgi:hypothetical protein
MSQRWWDSSMHKEGDGNQVDMEWMVSSMGASKMVQGEIGLQNV